MRTFYNCPHCSQTSKRQWNMKRHIERSHNRVQEPASSRLEPFASNRAFFRSNSHSEPRNTSEHPPNSDISISNFEKMLKDWDRALKACEKYADLKEWEAKLRVRLSNQRQYSTLFPFSFPTSLPSTPFPANSFGEPSISTNRVHRQQPQTSIPSAPNNSSKQYSEETPRSGSTLGYKGFVCENCSYTNIYPIQASSFRGSLKLNHICNQMSIQETIGSHNQSNILQDRERELIFRLTQIVNKRTGEQELIKLSAVRIPYRQFGPESISHEEYVIIDPIQRPVPSYIERAAYQGVAVIYKSEILEFLKIFMGTLGYFRFRVGKFPLYFFIYISNWIKPEDLVYS